MNVTIAEYSSLFLEGTALTNDEKLNKKYLQLSIVKQGFDKNQNLESSEITLPKPVTYFSALRKEITSYIEYPAITPFDNQSVKSDDEQTVSTFIIMSQTKSQWKKKKKRKKLIKNPF